MLAHKFAWAGCAAGDGHPRYRAQPGLPENFCMMNTQVLGLYFLPAGIIMMCLGGLWQLYVMLTESYTLNRYPDKKLVWVVSALFFSFSLAIYWFAPNARKKGWLFVLLGGGGLTLFLLARMWLPWR